MQPRQIPKGIRYFACTVIYILLLTVAFGLNVWMTDLTNNTLYGVGTFIALAIIATLVYIWTMLYTRRK